MAQSECLNETFSTGVYLRHTVGLVTYCATKRMLLRSSDMLEVIALWASPQPSPKEREFNVCAVAQVY